MGVTDAADTLQAEDVAAYLRQNPGFLADYPDLAGQLRVPREQGDIASLASYQLDLLRRKNREQARKLDELIRVAGDNEQLMARVHAFTISLLRADSAAAMLHSVAAGLTEDFDTDLVRVLLFHPVPDMPTTDWLLLEPDGPAALPDFSEFLARSEPQVGRLPPAMLQRVFGSEAESVQSAAMMHLGEAGLMAVGSHDPNRFHPGMGGVFLKLIGEAVATALERHQGAGGDDT